MALKRKPPTKRPRKAKAGTRGMTASEVVIENPSEGETQEAIKKAAGFITKLEANKPNLGSDQLKQKYLDLLQREPLLMEAYKASGGKVLL